MDQTINANHNGFAGFGALALAFLTTLGFGLVRRREFDLAVA